MHKKITPKNFIFICLVLWLFVPKITFACNVTANVVLVGIQNDYELTINSQPGDQFNIKCRDEIVNSGVVNKDYKLHMDNGAIFSVVDSERKAVINRLKKMHIMMNNNNGVHLMTK